jgi:hypothetical protein
MDTPAEAASPTTGTSPGWEAPDVIGVLLLIWIVYVVISKCMRPSETKDLIKSLRTFFEMLAEDDEPEVAAVDKEQLWDAIESERAMKVVFAGATKEQCKADYRRMDTEKKNKIKWAEFVTWADARLRSKSKGD